MANTKAFNKLLGKLCCIREDMSCIKAHCGDCRLEVQIVDAMRDLKALHKSLAIVTGIVEPALLNIASGQYGAASNYAHSIIEKLNADAGSDPARTGDK